MESRICCCAHATFLYSVSSCCCCSRRLRLHRIRLMTTRNTRIEMSGVSKYEFDHHGPWCQRVGADSQELAGERAERAKRRSVNMCQIVTQRSFLKWRKTADGMRVLARKDTYRQG